MTALQFNLDAALIRPGDKCEVVQMREDDPIALQVLGKHVHVDEFKTIAGKHYWTLKEPIFAEVRVDDFVSGRDSATNRLAYPKGSTMTINAIPAQYLRRVGK